MTEKIVFAAEGFPDPSWDDHRLLKLIQGMSTSVKVVSGDLARGFERSGIQDDGTVFGYAADPAWVQGVGDRIDIAADILLARLRERKDWTPPRDASFSLPGRPPGHVSADDRLR